MPASPVFIVGSPRSGTSILSHAMQAIGYEGFHEGNFLSLMTTLRNVTDRHFRVHAAGKKGVLVAQIDADSLKLKIENLFKEFVDQNYNTPLWFDKTGNPEMILAIPTLRRLWPDSVFIFAKRRAIENVLSRQGKFPHHTFDYHCSDWAKNMAAWRAARETMPRSIFVEVDQQDIARRPEAVAARLSDFLALDDTQRTKLAKTFTVARPQESTRGSAARVVSLDALPWTEAQVATFMERCGPEMDAFGYSTDESYFLQAALA